LSQEERKEISFEEWLKLFNADVVKLKEKMPEFSCLSVERVMLMIAIKEIREVHQHFDWIYPQLKQLLKQDIRTQKKLLKGLR